jgi:hypothetical protein
MIVICEVARPIYVIRKRALNFVQDFGDCSCQNHDIMAEVAGVGWHVTGWGG